MSPWWLVLIIPISVAAGVVLAAMLAAGKEADRISEAMARQQPEPVTVKVTRYIPQDLWMNKILEQDVKGANAWLAISMGQMLGPQLAPHTTVKALYRPEQADYQVTAWVRVVPREGRK